MGTAEDDKEQLQEEEDFNGPLANRGCTDVLFLALFAAFLVGMGILSQQAYQEGNVALLIRGYDSYGNICGQKNEKIEGVPLSGMDMRGKGNLLFLDPNDLAAGRYAKCVCVQHCPHRNYGYQEGIPLEFCLPGTTNATREENCPSVPLFKSTPIMHRCTPSELLDQGANQVAKQAAVITDVLGADALENFASEVERSWHEILYICLVGLVCSFLILILMRVLAALFVYTIYLLVILGSIAGTAFLWGKYVKEKDDLEMTPVELRSKEDKDNVTAFLIYSIAASIVTGVLLLIMLVMWSRVKLVIALFKEAGSVVMAMPLLVIQPLFTFAAVALFLAYWATTLLYIASCKDPHIKETDTGDFVTYESNRWMKRAFWYHLFGLFWVTQFLVACQLMIIAGAVASWYFTRDKANLGWFPILASFYRTVRYHLGTLAFGSLIIAIVQFLQAILTYIQAKLGNSENFIAQFIIKCLFCFLWCLEKFLKFINRNAYIMTAIYGYHFCKAAKRGFELLLANCLRVAAINTVGDFCLFLAKILVVIIVVIAGIFITETNEEIEIDAIPIAIGAIVTYVIAHVFLSVYEMVVDTLFLCFCEDSARNDGSAAKPYYMSENLKDFVDTTAEEIRKKEEAKNEKKKLIEGN